MPQEVKSTRKGPSCRELAGGWDPGWEAERRKPRDGAQDGGATRSYRRAEGGRGGAGGKSGQPRWDDPGGCGCRGRLGGTRRAGEKPRSVVRERPAVRTQEGTVAQERSDEGERNSTTTVCRRRSSETPPRRPHGSQRSSSAPGRPRGGPRPPPGPQSPPGGPGSTSSPDARAQWGSDLAFPAHWVGRPASRTAFSWEGSASPNPAWTSGPEEAVSSPASPFLLDSSGFPSPNPLSYCLAPCSPGPVSPQLPRPVRSPSRRLCFSCLLPPFPHFQL